MNRAGYSSAKVDLDRAAQHLEDTRRAPTLDQAMRGWSDFLIQLERAIVKLGIACSDSKSSPWFGEIIRLRRTDDLLSYVKNARDADHHGIDPISKAEPARATILSKGPITRIDYLQFGPAGVVMGPQAARDLHVQFEAATVTLLPVRNRGRLYQVPSRHLDKPVPQPSMIAVGDLALAFAQTKFAEADKEWPE